MNTTLSPRVIRDRQLNAALGMLRLFISTKHEDTSKAVGGFLDVIGVQSAMLAKMLDLESEHNDMSDLLKEMLGQRDDLSTQVRNQAASLRELMRNSECPANIIERLAPIVRGLDALVDNEQGDKEDEDLELDTVEPVYGTRPAADAT